MMNMKKELIFAVLAVFCLTVALLVSVPTRSQSSKPEYDPWLDVNDDGIIEMMDFFELSNAFGAEGTPMTKAGILFDSGWIDITDMAGRNITVTHGLNITDWNDESIDVSITGKTSTEGELQRYVGLTGQIQGWNKTYGGTGDEQASALVKTVDGGYALAGYTNSFGAGGYDFWLVKTDASGNAQWNKTYGGTSADSATSVVQTADGGYALAGPTSSFGAGGYDFWLVKTDASGNVQWNKTYGGTNDDMAFAFVQTSDGGYALAGYTKSFGVGSNDFWLVKTDSAGNAQWNKTYGGTSIDYATALVKTVDGGYALAGYTGSFGVGPNDFWLVKTDASGNVGGFESGLAWIDSSANTVTLYRGATDAYWNYVRVRVWKVKESP